ncbi:hypothetical protein EWM64_g4167 [Hericium alpestre]|uniref:Uncharacterized protein n=1 Tax=Hericium alpestre TaxID=135208 RepID=A0A4Z0A053_9AGAM|nr:hypothetical protein EWM64_g4167 [Hericium alpestre]
MRAAANHMVRANGGITEDDQYQYDPMADPTDWVDNNDVGISANSGEVDDVVCIATEHIIVPCI